MSHKLNIASKALILGIVAAVFWIAAGPPSQLLRAGVQTAAGNPPYQGAWILASHVLLFTTLGAGAATMAWIALARVGWLQPFGGRVALWRSTGLAVAIALAAAALSFAYVGTAMPGALHPFRFEPWGAVGNLFSNLYEEVLFRGFLLAALSAVFGFWPAALISSAAFALVHTQYPLGIKALAALFGLSWCWLTRSSGGLLAPWISHCLLDLVVDPFL